jgi:hypothetical protein
VIKRIVFGGTATDAHAADAAHDVRPLRAVVCTALHDVIDTQPKHETVRLEWFADSAHFERFEAWLPATQAAPLDTPTVVADEVVLRGADWLEQRWRVGGPKLKHMALARRRSELSAAEFSERWRAHAGGVTRGGTRTPIPDEARGLAYVQNHPRPRAAGEWAYDAVNEVYFDDLADLERRIAWFRENLDAGVDDLVQESWFLAVREAVLFSARE